MCRIWYQYHTALVHCIIGTLVLSIIEALVPIIIGVFVLSIIDVLVPNIIGVFVPKNVLWLGLAANAFVPRKLYMKTVQVPITQIK